MAGDPRKHLGDLGERLASEHLERLGLAVVERNYRTRCGEIDIIARDARTLVFCEVKTRRSSARTPFESIGALKQRQVRRMAAEWLSERTNRAYVPELRFDAVAVTIDARGRLVGLEHLEAAF